MKSCWWFGTFGLFFSYVGNSNPNWTFLFFRGVETTNQKSLAEQLNQNTSKNTADLTEAMDVFCQECEFMQPALAGNIFADIC